MGIQKGNERRSRKMNILTTPRFYTELEREAATRGCSVNEIVNRLFAERYPEARAAERAAALIEELEKIYESFPELRNTSGGGDRNGN